jgi:outer membrane protein assembly factor BamE (lipoprotein component of BamABCDE complex)
VLKKALLICLLFVQGCSVYMAADGTKEPQVSNFKDGMSRFQIESILGAPVSYKKLAYNQSQAIYEFEIGNEPDSGRAALWLAADIFTLFIAEFFTTPYEMSKGETKRLTVIYNNDDIVTSLEI